MVLTLRTVRYGMLVRAEITYGTVLERAVLELNNETTGAYHKPYCPDSPYLSYVLYGSTVRYGRTTCTAADLYSLCASSGIDGGQVQLSGWVLGGKA